MHKFALVLGAVLGIYVSASAQDVPRLEVLGAYSYLNVDTNGVSSRQNASGWETSFSANLSKRFAVESDLSAYYKTFSVDLAGLGLGTASVGVHDFGLVGGPRVNFGSVFFHALVGVDRLTGSAYGYSASQDSLAGGFGGGIQQKVADHWAMRISADYVLTQHNIFGSPGATYRQDNFRAAVGFVYIFGGSREYSSRARSQAAGTASQAKSISEAATLGVSGYAIESGFEITSVQSGSPAAQSFLNPGDVITGIDGREVHTGADIESAIAASANGTIKVSCLVQTTAVGMMASEREVAVR